MDRRNGWFLINLEQTRTGRKQGRKRCSKYYQAYVAFTKHFAICRRRSSIYSIIPSNTLDSSLKNTPPASVHSPTRASYIRSTTSGPPTPLTSSLPACLDAFVPLLHAHGNSTESNRRCKLNETNLLITVPCSAD
jgi:hypothetical protein